MTTDTTIREQPDKTTTLGLYPVIFPEEDLVGLVANLLDEEDVLSLGAYVDDELVGHVAFAKVKTSGEFVGSLLGPLGVLPAFQKQGLGDRLVRHGLEVLKAKGVAQVFVYGDPGYYSRFGFEPKEEKVVPPYPLNPEYEKLGGWQSLELTGSLPPGKLSLVKAWREPKYWS